jgi:hypothetical protein
VRSLDSLAQPAALTCEQEAARDRATKSPFSHAVLTLRPRAGAVMAGPWATSSAEAQRQPNEAAADTLGIILDQTRETLELVRSLVALLLQQHGDSDGPKLEDLIAALVAQQRNILVCVHQVQADLTALHHRLEGVVGAAGNGHARGSGASRA